MNHLTFCTTLDRDTLAPLDYTVSGELSIENEIVPIGFSSSNFDRVFSELAHWTRQINKLNVTFSTTMQD